MNNPIFVALDVDSVEQAQSIADAVSPYVGGFKLGPRLLVRHGESIVSKLSTKGLVFVDNKYYDIPSTVVAAVRASFEAGASFVTVHAANGSKTLQELAQLEAELCQQRPFKILVVTVLTSFAADSLPPHWQQKPIDQLVQSLAQLSIDSGLSGLVCSAEEVAGLRQQFPEAFLLTPGIRMAEDAPGDQKRVVTPNEALRRGASALVVGRPIVQSDEPQVAAQKYCLEVGASFSN